MNPQVIDSENNVMIDVDFTLANWIDATVPGVGKVAVEYAGRTVYLTPHHYHIAIVKSYYERGFKNFLWSANGFNHATQVMYALGLENYVHFVMSKPCKHMDDNSNAASILGPRVFEEDLLKPLHMDVFLNENSEELPF